MIEPIDKLIKLFLKNHLHPQRESIINQALSKFKVHYPQACAEDILKLEGKFKFEAVRIYKVVDQAILKGNLLRAKYIFWFMALFGTIWGVLGGFSGENIFSYFSPLIMASLAWFISWATIPILYNARIIGAMNSTAAVFVSENSFVKRSQQLANNTLILEEIPSDDRNSTTILIRSLEPNLPFSVSNVNELKLYPDRHYLASPSNTPLFPPHTPTSEGQSSGYGTFAP